MPSAFAARAPSEHTSPAEHRVTNNPTAGRQTPDERATGLSRRLLNLAKRGGSTL